MQGDRGADAGGQGHTDVVGQKALMQWYRVIDALGQGHRFSETIQGQANLL